MNNSFIMKKYFPILLIFFFISCGEKKDFIHPSNEIITKAVYASGFVKSIDQYQVYATSSGLLEKIWVHEGDVVKKGQTLFSVSNNVSKLNMDNAQLVAANADIRANAERLNEISLSIDLSKKKMENDKLNLDRQRKLWAQEIGSKSQLEQLELSYANSKSTYESAQLRYSELKKQLEFASNQSKKSLSISKSMLGDYTVKSEVEGKVYAILKEKGELISPQVPIAIVGNASNFILYLQVDENDIVKVQLGQKVFITMDSYKGKLFEAMISKINPLMNEKSRTFEIEANFTKQPDVLYPNLTVEANIVLNSKENVLTIPRSYLIDDEFVMISAKEKKKVKVGLKDYQKAEILEGLTKEDKIYMPK